LYIAEMSNPWTLRTDRVQISTPIYTWEVHGLPINEGPQILIHDGKLHIIYSASGYWTPQYALGRLTYNGTGSLLNPASWTKASQPVFQATPEVVGVGHASFVKSPDVTQDWIVYHAHANPARFNEDRVVHIQPFSFSADGTPNFGSPLPPGQPIPAPSRGPEPERLFLAGDYDANGSVDARDRDTWSATFGMTIFAGTSADGSGNGVVDAADYVVWRNAFNAVSSSIAPSVPGVAFGAVIKSADEPQHSAGESINGLPMSDTLVSTYQANPRRNASPIRQAILAHQLADWVFDNWPIALRFQPASRRRLSELPRVAAAVTANTCQGMSPTVVSALHREVIECALN
jgi:hypothetical protein